MKISAATKLYAVLGHPIAHSLSPAMQNAALAAMGLDAVYMAFDVPPEGLMQVLPVLAELGCAGLNLTVPLKEVAFRGLADLDDAARRLGSVNTVHFSAGGMRGYSTDGKGFLLALQEEFRITPQGMSVLLLGCGGAGRAVAMACASEGCARIITADLDAVRSSGLSGALRTAFAGLVVEDGGAVPHKWPALAARADLIVHATPVGMHPNEPALLAPGAFRRGQYVYDLIYMFPETVLMRAARAGGAQAANGLGMLLHQGAFSLKIWTGREAPVPVMRQVLEKAVYGDVLRS